MKRSILLIFSCLTTISVFAQLTVDANGNVGIGDTLTSYNSQLSINGAGLNTATVYVKTTDRYRGIYSENYTTNKDWTYGLYGRSFLSTKKHVGLSGVTTNSTPLSTGRTFGILGCASNATSGYNCGVFGGLDGSQNGGAIVASIYHAWGFSYAINGRYAGYFDGPVLATEEVIAPTFSVPSSASNITNVSNLDGERSYQGIMSLTPVEYKHAYSLELGPEVMDTISAETMAGLEKVAAEKKATARSHFGFIAEEVQKYYPELVHQNSKGELSVDYIGLIPLLIQTVQQLDAEVKVLRAGEGIVKGIAPETEMYNSEDYASDGQGIQISNNGLCEIEYTLPDAVKSAKLFIYSISGKLIESRIIDGRGAGKLSIDTSKLNKGIYIYTIMADGQSVISRQMIVQ